MGKPPVLSRAPAVSVLQDLELVIFDFDGVFTDNTVIVDENGVEAVTCWRSDGLGLARLKDVGVKFSIISTEKNDLVQTRAKKLQAPCMNGIHDKASAVVEMCKRLSVTAKKTMFVGNDINDIPAFKIVGYPVAVADSYPEVLPYVQFLTEKPGGRGAVREVCDTISSVKRISRGESIR